MSYSEKVIDHYENPRNVGSLDSKSDEVGTGMVGAPACFSGDTLIAIAENKYLSLKEAYNLPYLFVWSFNINKNIFEIKKAITVYSGKKTLYKLYVDNKEIWVTEDHKFLMLNNEYKENKDITEKEIIMPFYRKINSNKNNEEILNTGNNIHIRHTKETRIEDCFTLQVEENNNYIIITDITKNIQSGIVVKNCGDVMKLQIKVNEEGIIEDAKFKTYGCVIGNTHIHTPNSFQKIKDLNIGDEVLAWNGETIIANKITNIIKKIVPTTSLLFIKFKDIEQYIVCTKQHIFWLSSHKPIEAQHLTVGDCLFGFNIHPIISEIKELNKTNKFDDIEFLADGNVYIYDLQLEEGANIYFSNYAASHNCGSAIASSSLVTELVKGKTLDEAVEIKNTDIASELALPPVKIHCSILAEDAIKAAVANYKEKQSKKTQSS